MKSAVFLYNANSGRGRAVHCVEAVCALLREGGYAVEACAVDFGADPFDGREGIDLMVVAGGDGTVNFVLNCMKRRSLDIPLGIIPSGTANDFAGALGMSSDPLEAARQIAGGVVERVDCGRVNDLYFINVLSFGLFTTTSQHTSDRSKHRIGRLAYIVEGVKEFRSMHAVPLEVVADGEAFDLDSLIVLVFNGATAGGFHLARRASVRDGLFDCVMLEKRSLLRSAAAVGRYLLGGNPKIIRQMRVRRLEIRSANGVPTDVDGQPGARFPLHVECLAGALRVVAPRA